MKKNVLPAPGSLSSQIWPPISSTSRLQIVSPSPVPPCLRVVDMSAWVKGWKRRAACSGVMPTPVSRTEKRSLTRSPVCSSSSALSRISPRSVNFTALLTRFVRIWPRRSGSPRRPCGTEVGASARNSRPFSWAFCPVTVVTVEITSSSWNGVVSRSSLPASIFEKSRMSLMIPSSDVPALWTLPM